MKRTTQRLAVLALLTGGIGHAAVPDVAVDIAPVHSLVAQVMGDVGSPHMIVAPGDSPHSHALRPSEARALQDASLVFWISPVLTPWLGDAIANLADDATAVQLLDVPGTTVLAQRSGALFDVHSHASNSSPPDDDAGEHHAHAVADDDHGAANGERQAIHRPDPHAWLDIANAAVWLRVIATELARQDPEHATTYRDNAAAAATALQTLHGDIRALLQPLRDRHFIVFHDAYQYFEESVDLPASGAISISDAARPGPARLRQIQARVHDAQVSCVLAEPQFNPDLVATVLENSDARTASLDPLGSHLSPGPDLYPALMRELAQSLAGCLQGQ